MGAQVGAVVTISFCLDYAPCGLAYSAPAIAEMANGLGVPPEKIIGLAWWRGAGQANDVVHPTTLSRLGQRTIAAHGRLVPVSNVC